MMYKCKYCDKKGEKSINSNEDEYLKVKSSYCHSDCHISFLITKKKMSKKDATIEVNHLMSVQKRNIDDIKLKQEFVDYVQSYYNTTLTTWQYTKINQVVQGRYKSKMKEGISYFDLYEMWTNQKFLRKLEKISYSKNIKKENRFDYDLGIIVSEYEKYKKAKIKKMSESIEYDSIKKQQEATKNALKNVENNNEEEVDIYDMI